MIDWQKIERVLVDSSEPAIKAFFELHPRESVSAIGYVFELWNCYPSFDLVANTRDYYQRSITEYRRKWPDSDTTDDEFRWNSGNFQYPACLIIGNELGPEWESESERLHALAAVEEHFDEVHTGIVRICTGSLVALAQRGVFGDFNTIDFIVQEYDDRWSTVKERDLTIHRLLQSTD